MTECACGLTGFPGCTVLLPGLNSASDALDAQCFNGDCEVVDGEALCLCDAGFKGDLCDEERDPLFFNYIVATAVPMLFILGGILYARKYALESFKIPSSTLVTSPWSWCSPMTIFLFRFCVLVFWFFMVVVQTGVASAWILQAFTIWSSYMLLFMFAIGTYLSWKAINGRTNEGDLTFIEKAFWAIQSILLSNTILIFLVVWLLLYPAASAAGNPEGVVNFNSFFQHGVNVAFVHIDFWLCGVYAKRSHASFVLIYGATYAAFHGFLQIVRERFQDEGVSPIYFFLATDSPILIVWLLGLVTVLVGFHFFAMLASRIKRKFVGDEADALVATTLEK